MVARLIAKTAIFGKVKNYEDEDDHPIHFKTEFPAIVFYNTLTAIQSKTTVCPPNENELDFRISLNESDDEDYTDFENEFPAIVYNDGLTSKSDLGIEPLVNAEHIYEFNLIDETSLPEYDEEIVSLFNDLFNDIHPNEKDDDDNNIDIIQSSEDNEITHGENRFPDTYMASLPAADQRHPWLRYEDLAVRLRMVYSGEGKQVFVSHAWRRLFEIRAPLVREFILEFLSTCRISDTVMDLDTTDTLCFQLGGARRRMMWRYDRLIPDKGNLRDYWIEISSDRDFLGPAPSYVLIRDPVRRLCHRMIAYSISGRGQASKKVVTRELPLINIHELGRLHICTRYEETWTWVAHEPKRQQATAAGADEAGLVAEEVAQEILVPAPAPAQAPPPPPPAPQPRTMSQRIERLEEEPFDSTLVGSSGLSFRRRVMPRTGDASTSTAPHTDAQPDP
ncbi:hypothetical protein Tco_1090767 [Tanacetum coccineum]|uniref:Uncharacterized protein n=1 Tax=Tanacetum coccineum TaxID=301880 RepID=A0ABQ5I6C8_9ASTR